MDKPSSPTPTSTPTLPPTPPPPSPKPRLTICPYCGSQTRSYNACTHCHGKFDPLSRQATQNAMGPWFIRDEANPHRPGCSYATLVGLIERGSITADTVIRGPSSRQFWTLARWCPGVAHRLGVCHSCQQPTMPTETDCGHCGASFRVVDERQQLGLGEVRQLPGQRGPGVRVDPHTTVPTARATAPQALVSAAVTGAGQKLVAEGQLHDQTGSDAEESTPEPAIDPRYLRLKRELRNARRWRTVWAVGFSLVVMVVAGVFIVRSLDLDAGPVGKWLNARQQGVPSEGGEGGREGVGAGSSAGVVPITPSTIPSLSPRDDGTATAQRTEPELPDQPTETTPATPATTPPVPDSTEPPPAPPSDPSSMASQARLDLLASLRRLR